MTFATFQKRDRTTCKPPIPANAGSDVLDFHTEPLAENRNLILGEVSLDETENLEGVRCPLCGWIPKSASRWDCAECEFPERFFEGCYTHWNTFDTQGRCPGCGHQWRWTMCLSCGGWSLHEEWYVEGQSA